MNDLDRDLRPGAGSRLPNWGTTGDRVLRDCLLGHDPVGRAAAHARPRRAWIGPRDRRPDDNRPRLRGDRPTDAARRPSRTTNWSRCGHRRDAERAAGLDSPGDSPRRRRHPSGIELAVLIDRLVGTERFLRRRRPPATRPPSIGAGARPRKAVWCRSAPRRTDAASANHPGAATQSVPRPKRSNQNSNIRR